MTNPDTLKPLMRTWTPIPDCPWVHLILGLRTRKESDMAIITHLTPEDVEWYKRQVEFVGRVFRDVVEKNNILNPETLEPKKPWKRNCHINDACFHFLDDMAHAINRIEAAGIESGHRITSTPSIERWPPSMRQGRESGLAWDCLKPKLVWASSWAAA